MATNGVGSYAVYQEALMRIAAGRGDYRDDVIVSLWKTNLSHIEKRDELKKELKLNQKKFSDQAYYIDVLESRQPEEEQAKAQKRMATYLKGLTNSKELLH